MKSVKLTKAQIAHLKAHVDKEQGIKLGLEALSQLLRVQHEATWEYARSISPKAKEFNLGQGCLLLDE